MPLACWPMPATAVRHLHGAFNPLSSPPVPQGIGDGLLGVRLPDDVTVETLHHLPRRHVPPRLALPIPMHRPQCRHMQHSSEVQVT